MSDIKFFVRSIVSNFKAKSLLTLSAIFCLNSEELINFSKELYHPFSLCAKNLIFYYQ